MGFEVDESNWPIVAARWQGTVSDGELNVALNRISTFLARGERFGMLLDSRGGGGLSPEQRAAIIAHMKSHAELTRKYLVQAAVVDNLLQRTLFYAVNLIFPNPFPSRTFSEPEAARRWLTEQLALPPPR
jgi:hypothetical protein